MPLTDSGVALLHYVLPMAAWYGSCITLPSVELKICTLLIIEMVAELWYSGILMIIKRLFLIKNLYCSSH